MTNHTPQILALRDDRDDARRLVLADDLQQRGDPLGELIVVQCELAQLPNVASARRIDLQLRSEALVERHRKRWVEHLLLTDHEKTTCTFVRGFPSGVTLTAERFLRVGEEVFAQSSFDTLMLTKLGPLARVKSASLARVAHLKLQLETPPVQPRYNTRTFEPAKLASLFASDALCERLRTLDLSGCGLFESRALETLANAKGLQALTSLNLATTYIDDADVVGLCESKGLPNLASLELGGSRLTEASAAAIADSRWSLASLTFSFGVPVKNDTYSNAGQMKSEGLVRLAQSGKLAPLTTLVVENHQVEDAGLEALAKVPFERLDRLSLAGNLFTSNGVRALLESKATAALTTLDLSLNPIRFAVGALAKTACPKLATLRLSTGELGDAEIEKLCTAPWMASLVELDLSDNAITDVGAEMLSRVLPKIVSLDLRGNDLSAKATKKLSALPSMLVLST